MFSTEVELPMVTICNKLRMGSLPGNLTRKDLVSGKFFPDDPSIVDIDEMIEKAIQEYNFFLNLTGKLCSQTKQKVSKYDLVTGL